MSTPLATPVLCGSLSRFPVGLGMAMHEAGYRALGLSFRYVPFGLRGTLEDALRGMRSLGIRGLGVSMPFKIDVLPLLDELSPLCRRIGAANTIVLEPDGRLVGHNTDCIGAVRALEEVRSVKGGRCLVLGAGGAARAVAFGLADAGAHVFIANRTDDRARALASDAGSTFVPFDRIAADPRPGEELHEHLDAIVNATSAGMRTDDPASEASLPIAEGWLTPARVVMDIVYKPIETLLVRTARARRATVVHGARMLLHQAGEQFRLYTGRAAPLDAMDVAIRGAIGEPRA